jgi:hypothetical protein
MNIQLDQKEIVTLLSAIKDKPSLEDLHAFLIKAQKKYLLLDIETTPFKKGIFG